MSARPLILLAAHGERGGAANNNRLASLVQEVGERFSEADVASVLINVEGAVDAAIHAAGLRPLLVLPLLFSDGFFFERRLKPHVGRGAAGARQRLAPPLALWPSFAPFLSAQLAMRLDVRGMRPDLVLVAHGSQPSGRSAACARDLAARMAPAWGAVRTGFLEEAPSADDVMAGAGASYAAIGLFFGAGLHGAEDFERLVREARTAPLEAFTVGALPDLPGYIAAEARSWLGRSD